MIRGNNDHVKLDCSDRMSWVIVCYAVVFLMDLLVGGSIVIWKCVYAKVEESDCQLALAGTMGSLGVWLILLLGMPFLLVKFDQYNMCKGLTKKFKGVIYNLRGMRSREIIIHNRVYMPTTTSYCCKDVGFNYPCKCSDETQICLPASSSVYEAFEPETEPVLNSGNADSYFQGRQFMVYLTNEKSSASVKSTLVQKNN
ncbi:hypothetical protein CHS0354_034638 [Potamilus streckersoni]|uniref:Uncharacterized protein n=1 Tax=Potamilus streckersoni TaxID=2493646 RepID=A0AAE0WBR2_9BIVA|nr:hypothetical protein CHS0354_034638 [Potamilus streckersoni]